MTFRSFMTRTHRFLGALMSVLFVAWFVSGLVLIYHAYPKYSMDEELKHSARLPESLPTVDSLHALFTSLQLDTVPLERLKISGGTYADSRARLVIHPVEGERRERIWRPSPHAGGSASSASTPSQISTSGRPSRAFGRISPSIAFFSPVAEGMRSTSRA